MNGQQPNHLTGYGMHPQILDSQYSRMLGQQQQAQGVQNNQLYAQGFYPQTYMPAQVQPQTILQNAHQQIQRQQAVNQASQINAAQYYQFQMAQQSQAQHIQQPSQIQYYQQPPQQIHVQRQTSQDQQIHIQMRQQQQQQAHAYQAQNQQTYYEQQPHHQPDYQFDQSTTRSHQYPQQSASQQYVAQQHHSQVQNHHKAVHKASPAKEAENSAAHNEAVRKQRLEDERQRLLERERKENERVQEELQARQRQANQIAQGVQGRLGQFKYPITFATCHATTNLARLLPVPQENVQATANLHCHDPASAAQIVNSEVDHDLIEYMSNLLQASFDEVRSIQTKQNDGEGNIYEADNLPILMKNIHINNQYSFHIQSEFDDLTNDPDLERHFQAIADEVVSGGVVSDLLQLDDVAVDNLPSTSTASINRQSTNIMPMNKIEDQRRQISSIGKQPKGKGSGPPRRKRDMVGELIDSLTPFYDVSTDRRGRRRARGEDRASISDEENHPDHNQQDGEAKFFQKSRKQKKNKQEEEFAVRPPTPTEVLHQRDLEWSARQKERQDKLRRRHLQAEAEGHDTSAEGESQQKVENLMEQIFDQVGGFDVLNSTTDKSNLEDFLIERPVLEELRQEVSKLKMMRKLHKVNGDRLAKLVQMLEKNIRDVVDEEGNLLCSEILSDDDVGNETARELVHDRFIRATEAGSLGLLIMTAHKMPKQVMVEDTVERATQLCKQMLRLVIFPAADSIVRNSKAKKTDERMKKRRIVGEGFNYWVQNIYVRIVEMIECFSELIRFQVLNDVVVVQLSTMATNPFFVDGIGDIHMVSIQLLSVIFRKFENLRPGIIQELLIAIHQIPSWKNPKNCYRLSNTENIHNFTVLILQLIQSVVVIPVKRKNEDGEEEKPNEEDDSSITACFVESKKWAVVFLKGFLHKCTAKAEEDYRRRFELFLHDLLAALYRPEWPAAELMLTVLGNLLVVSFRDKQLELSLRTACLDYLGTIAAKLKRDRVAAEKATGPHEKARLDVVVRGILYEEANDPTKLLDEIDIESISSTEKIQRLQQALIDYLIATKSDNDVSAEYAISFYVGEWYKDTADDMKVASERHKAKLGEGLEGRDLKKEERRFQRIMEKCDEMREFLIKLADKKSLKKRSHYIAKTGNYLIDNDAFWTVKYLASKKEFSQSFDSYLKYIVYGIQAEQSVGLRTKAMRCLTQIIEADHQVLAMPEVYNAVNARMMDMNVAVREATIELLGKYLISRPDLFDSYYSILNDRIMDTGVAVRKRVIRIFREYVEKMPDSEKIPEILSKIIRRVSDEEGVKKLALETLMNLWFTPSHDRDARLTKKVVTLIDAVSFSLKESKAEHIENLFTTILKKDDIEKNVLIAARQIVDALVDYVLNLDARIAEENNEELSLDQKTEREKRHQARLLSSLTTLSIISKVRPEIMVRHAEVFLPYLSMNAQTPTELQVLNQVINMLERIIPLMDHPSDSFLNSLDEKICAIIKGKGMLLIQSAIACLGAVCKKWTRIKTKVSNVFLQYITFLKDIKTSMGDNINAQIPGNKRPTLMRCLFSVGPLVRYFDFDLIIDGNAPSPSTEFNAKRSIGVYPEAIYSILSFFVRSPVAEINQKAVTSLGHICAQFPEFFDRTDLRNMYQHLLSNNDEIYLQRKIEVLRNLHLFLTVEEERMIKAGEEYKRLRDAGELEDDLNATDTRGSLNSAIIQIFWKHVLSSYLHVNDNVRLAVSQVVYSTMMQGLVTPGDPLPTMIAMTTDPLPAIRNKIEGLVKEVDQKYSGMLASKAVRGIRWSFEMQKRLAIVAKKSYVLRGFRPTEHCSGNALDDIGLPKQSSEAVAILNVLYTCLRTNRQQRRSFLNNVVRMFSEDYRETVGLEEMLFIADNLATFPYQLMDEPLFLIHTADSIISLSGQNVLSSFKEMLLPKHPGELLDEEDEFTPQNLYRRLPEDKTGIYELMKASQACFLLLYVKTYLKKLYRLSDAKVSAYSPSEAAKVYEKPIIRQSIPVFRPDLTLQELRPEVIAQRSTIEGHINLCEQIAYFRTMFYSLDIHDEADEEEEKDSRIFFVGFIINSINNFGTFYPVAFVGGIFWALGNVVQVPTMRRLGMAVSMLVWNSVNCIIGWTAGFFGLFGLEAKPASIPWMNLSGVLCILLGAVFFAFVKKTEPDDLEKKNVTTSVSGVSLLDASLTKSSVSSIEEVAAPNHTAQGTFQEEIIKSELQEDEDTSPNRTVGTFIEGEPLSFGIRHNNIVPSHTANENFPGESLNFGIQADKMVAQNRALENGFRRNSLKFGIQGNEIITPGNTVADYAGKSSSQFGTQKDRFIGLGMALLAGVFFGFNVVPVMYIQDNKEIWPNAPEDGLAYVFSHFCGIFMTSSIIFLGYCIFRKNKPQVNPEIVMPSIVAGILWATAQALFFSATEILTSAVTYPIVTMVPGCVAALWSVFYFREIRGKRDLIILTTAIATTFVGIFLVAVSK